MIEYEYVLNQINNGVYKTTPEMFKTDLLLIYGMLNRPQGEKIYNIAYKYGNENGYKGILDLFHDLVGLVNI